MSSSAGTGKDAVDALREKGVKAGLVKLRVFRPFPAAELAEALSVVRALAIMDKSDSFSGNGGPLGAEVRAALYGRTDGVKTINIVYGLGGRDIKVEDFYKIYEDLAETAEGKKTDVPYCTHLGMRE
jgi:pyruvate ferredoxin oxidoreductase alpha subunit